MRVVAQHWPVLKLSPSPSPYRISGACCVFSWYISRVTLWRLHVTHISINLRT